MSTSTTVLVRTIDRLAEAAASVRGVRPSDVRPGDQVVVRTRNSTYALAALPDGSFLVSGGWFASKGVEHQPVRVRGCTWGGSALLERMIAAPGMCIEFDNGVCTTRAREVELIRDGAAEWAGPVLH